MAKKAKNIEEQLQRLETIQTVLEDGSAPIEEMLKQYEEGMGLVKEVREFLQNAEQRVIEIRQRQASSDVDATDE